MKKVLYKLCFFLILIGTIVSFYQTYKTESIQTYYQIVIDHNNSYDKSLFNDEKVKSILYKTYYLSNSPKHFSSVGLRYPLPNSYLFYWTLKIQNTMESIPINEDITSLAKRIELDKEDFPAIIKNYQLLSIYSLLGIPLKNFPEVEKVLVSHYDEKENLYFSNSNTDSINVKLNTTKKVLELYKNINTTHKNNSEIEKKIINMYNNDAYFNNESNQTGSILVQLLFELGIRYNDPSLKDRTNWLEYWNSEILEHPEIEDINYIYNLKELKTLNAFFEKEIAVDHTLLNKIFIYYNSFEKTGGIQLFGSIDAQTLYAFIELCNNYTYKYPYTDELTSYIRDCNKSGYNKSGKVNFNIEDNFYGVVLANRFNFDYKKLEMKNHLEVLYNYIIENSYINERSKLKNIYYLVLSCDELEIELIHPEVILKSVQLYFKEIRTSEGYYSLDTLNDYLIGLSLFDILNGDLDKETKNEIVSFVKYLDNNEQIYTNIAAVNLYFLSKYTEEDALIKKISNNVVNKCLSTLYKNGGYGSSKKNNIIPNLNASLEAIKFKQDIGALTNEDIENTKKFTLTKIDENSNLKDLYNLVLISEFFNK